MKYAMTALAVVFLAGAGPALAQDRGDRPGRPQRLEQADRFQRDGAGRQGGWNRREAPVARETPRAPEAAAAPREQRERPQRDGGRQRDWSRREAPAVREAPRPPEAVAAPAAVEPRRADRPAYRGTGGQPRDDDRRGDARRGDDRRDWDRRDNDRRGDGRREWDRNDRRDWDGRRDNDRRWDRRDNDRRDWERRRDNDRRDHRRWERGRYPQVYVNPHRYRYSWRPPSGFYLRSWGYGEIFPRGWYGPGWWIVDPWQFDLPLPPPGFEWVRSGPDALLIDEYSGRIVQVVRNVFWY